MKKFMILAILLVAMFSVVSVALAETQKITFSSVNEGVQISFNGFLSSCLVTRVEIQAYEGLAKEPERIQFSGIVMSVEVTDSCNGHQVVFAASGYQTLKPSELEVAKNLSQADLTGTFLLYDNLGTPHSVGVGVGCDADDESELRTRNMSRVNSAMYRSSSMFTGRTRGAICAGTVILEGVNLTPFQSYQSEIVSGKGRQTFMTK